MAVRPRDEYEGTAAAHPDKRGGGPSDNRANSKTKGPNELRKTQSAVQRVAAASWLPRLPKDQIKVIMRPRGGLDVARVKLMLLPRAINMAAALTEQQAEDVTMCGNKLQNILIISTSHHSNTAAYAKVQKIHMSVGAHEVAASVAAPNNTSKGVKNVDPSLDEATLYRLRVHARNPTRVLIRRDPLRGTVSA
ncbi:hypothetical protein HPB52_008381 [Rhipicephalus sanguineus]|uniref:Uncharacterized protein n=1 Tax=Rhipicephalus sanguineus TaxID=34632 RepID=A0A9D4PIF6_RHISA|nr:hypothetical protein HPB52_008381 [Rhipicephalus sanguineus]